MAISYMLGMGKLLRMIKDMGPNGVNALKIYIDQDSSGNISVVTALEKVNLFPGKGTMDPPLALGKEKTCPVPPGCDTDGNCKQVAEQYLKGEAENYFLEPGTATPLEENGESVQMIDEEKGQLDDNSVITFTIRAVNAAK